jgi:hypothetical protein
MRKDFLYESKDDVVSDEAGAERDVVNSVIALIIKEGPGEILREENKSFTNCDEVRTPNEIDEDFSLDKHPEITCNAVEQPLIMHENASVVLVEQK